MDSSSEIAPPGAIASASRLCAFGGGALLLLIVAVTAVNAGAFALDFALRHAGVRVPGLPGYEDFVRLATGSAFLMMLPWCQVMRGHIAPEAFTRRMGERTRRRLDRLWTFLIALAAAFLGAFLVAGMLESRADGVRAPILGWSEWPFYLPGIAALFLWAAAAGAQFLDGE